MAVRATLKEVKKQRDSINCPIEYKPFGKISPYLSYICLKIGITHNQVSIAWGVLGVISSLLMMIGGYKWIIIGAGLYQIAVLMDFMDGEMARILKKGDSLRGTYLDMLFSNTFRGLLVLGAGVGLYRTFGEPTWLIMGITASHALIIDNLAKLKVNEALIVEEKYKIIIENGKKINQHHRGRFEGFKNKGLMNKLKYYLPRWLTPNSPLSLLFITSVFMVVEYYLILITIISITLLLRSLYRLYNETGRY